MSVLDALAIVVAGLAAGAINAMVGSGTLITFPVLLFLGYAPLTANVSNNIGLVAGGFGSIHGYRDEIAGQGAILRRLIPASFAGAITGALLLLALPESAFKAIVPVLILIALVLVITGPRIQRWAATHHPVGEPPLGDAADHFGSVADPPADAAAVTPSAAGTALAPSGPAHSIAGWRGRLLVAGVFGAGVYGGYFGAAQGVLLLGIMSALLAEPLQRINGFKNVLGTTVNAVAAVVFVIVAWDRIDWAVAGLIGLGALAGGVIGGRLGRRLPPNVLRGVIVVVGTLAIVNLLR